MYSFSVGWISLCISVKSEISLLSFSLEDLSNYDSIY